MSLIKCLECGKEVSDKASICVHCGNPINDEKNNNYCKIVVENNKKCFVYVIICLFRTLPAMFILTGLLMCFLCDCFECYEDDFRIGFFVGIMFMLWIFISIRWGKNLYETKKFGTVYNCCCLKYPKCFCSAENLNRNTDK